VTAPGRTISRSLDRINTRAGVLLGMHSVYVSIPQFQRKLGCSNSLPGCPSNSCKEVSESRLRWNLEGYPIPIPGITWPSFSVQLGISSTYSHRKGQIDAQPRLLLLTNRTARIHINEYPYRDRRTYFDDSEARFRAFSVSQMAMKNTRVAA
jgi:hypothetical protein